MKKVKRYVTIKPPSKPPKDSLWRQFVIEPATSASDAYHAQQRMHLRNLVVGNDKAKTN
jgi:hypothetical protein